MTRLVSSVLLLAGLALVLAGCSRGGQTQDTLTPTTDPNPTTATATATPGSTPNPNASPEATPGTPEATGCERRLAPPRIWLSAESEREPPAFGSYFWQLPNGLAAKIESRGFQLHKRPIEVKQGETVKFEMDGADCPAPEQVTLKLYPPEGNIGPASEEPGAEDVFNPTTEPVTTTEIPAGTLEWTVDLEPGRYFVVFDGTWANPVLKDQPLTGQLSYFIEVVP